MAKIETLTRNGKQEPCINVHEPVGPWKVGRVRNLYGDVMLVQAAIYTLARIMNPTFIIGSTRYWELAPQPTGHYDSQTENAIQLFQKTRRVDLLKAYGVVDAGSYHTRNVVGREELSKNTETDNLVSHRLMTITLLHVLLRDSLGGDNYPEELLRRVPKLAGWLRS